MRAFPALLFLVLLYQLLGCTPPPPQPAVSSQPAAGDAPLRVQFSESTRGESTSWTWDFGDGHSSDLRNPIHVYRAAGSYDVSLTAQGPGGAGTTTRSGFVTVRGSAQGNNVLLIVADDISAADIECYGISPNLTPGLTPTISALAARGVLFENTWTNPFCSPSRAEILTGRYAFRTGIGNQIESSDIGLSREEITLNEALVNYADASYATAAFGKWHLEPPQTGWVCSPTDLHGFDVFDGNLFQVSNYGSWLHVACPPPGEVADGPWRSNNVRESATLIEQYMPAYIVDRAIDWIQDQESPWFCFLAPQTPYHFQHIPPGELQQVVEGEPCEPCDKFDRSCFEAALQAFDTKLGELLTSLGPNWEENVTVVFIADNGTPKGLLENYPAGHGKGSLYQGGLHVPLIVAGRAVAPGRRGARASELVSSTDLYRTITALAGAAEMPEAAAEDSISFLPLLQSPQGVAGHPFLYAEYFHPNALAPPYEKHFSAVRDQRYKLIYDVLGDTPRDFYDLAVDSLEERNLVGSKSLEPDTPAGKALEQLLLSVRVTLADGGVIRPELGAPEASRLSR